mmetsp:Transcript_2020/g.2907  ORF Transcript_2020/g.2907 Transcript_2020/m.2907 type:complete len:281 (+) Transcript_2020:25-867(+)
MSLNLHVYSLKTKSLEENIIHKIIDSPGKNWSREDLQTLQKDLLNMYSEILSHKEAIKKDLEHISKLPQFSTLDSLESDNENRYSLKRLKPNPPAHIFLDALFGQNMKQGFLYNENVENYKKFKKLGDSESFAKISRDKYSRKKSRIYLENVNTLLIAAAAIERNITEFEDEKVEEPPMISNNVEENPPPSVKGEEVSNPEYVPTQYVPPSQVQNLPPVQRPYPNEVISSGSPPPPPPQGQYYPQHMNGYVYQNSDQYYYQGGYYYPNYPYQHHPYHGQQ